MNTNTVEVLDTPTDSTTAHEDVLRLSASRIKMYLTCPRQYRYKYVDKVPTVLTGALAFGKAIHQVIHDLHQWSIYSGEPLHESAALANFARLWEKVVAGQEPVFQYDEEVIEYSQLAELILTGYVESQKDKLPPFLLEFPFAMDFHDIQTGQDFTLRGIIDRIDQTEEGLVVVDFKTGKRKPSARDLAFDVQLTIYAFAAKEVFGQDIVEVQLHHLRDQTIFHARRGAADERTLLHVTIPRVIAGIKGKQFTPHVGYWCRFCEYRERCQAEGPDQKP